MSPHISGSVHESRLNADGLGMRLEDFVSHPSAKVARLSTPEVLALRVYTTAAFRSINTPLREQAAERSPHPLPVTVNYIREAIGKLRAVEAHAGDQGVLDLWRGMKNLTVGASDFLSSGGTELAPMSTTDDLGVATRYALSTCSLLLKLRTKSFMQRGADLTFLSAFPAEREYLFPPLTFLQPTGKVVEVVSGGSMFTIVEVEPFAG